MISFTAEKLHEGMELFDLMEETFPALAKKTLKSLFKAGDITLNGAEAYGDDAIGPGDVIRVFVSGDLLGADLTPGIVYQDENFVVVDKPAGLLSASQTGEPNAVDMVEGFMKRQGEYNLDALMVPYLVYPLEKYVSGLMLLAKHEEAYLFLIEALSQRRIARYYICPVKGLAQQDDELMAYHMKDKASTRAKILKNFQKDAKPIVTRYSALAFGKNTTLLNARPITNGLHQVRAHLAFGGLPILGDEIYGDARFNHKIGAKSIALWLKTVVLEVGTSHAYAYLNGKRFESKSHNFPRCVYDQGLLKAD